MAAMIKRLSTMLTMVRIQSEGRATLYLYSKRCFDQNRQTEQQGTKFDSSKTKGGSASEDTLVYEQVQRSV